MPGLLSLYPNIEAFVDKLEYAMQAATEVRISGTLLFMYICVYVCMYVCVYVLNILCCCTLCFILYSAYYLSISDIIRV